MIENTRGNSKLAYKIYLISSYALVDKKEELNHYISKFVVDFNELSNHYSALFYYLKLMFSNDESKYLEYKSLIEKCFNQYVSWK